MRRQGLLIVLFLGFSIAFAAFDDTPATCIGAGYVWFTGTVYGNYSRCCGDDYIINGYWDNFYNSSHLCYGNITTNADLNKGFCEIMGYAWFSNEAIFADATNKLTGTSPYGIAVGDFNADGDLDVVTTDYSSDQFSFFAGDGVGGFADAITKPTGNQPNSIAVGDFNADGDLDVVVTMVMAGFNQFSFFAGNGDGTFADAINKSTATNPHDIAVGDFNADGDLDVVVAVSIEGTDQFSFFAGNGAGGFADAVIKTTGNQPKGIAVGDFNGDGDLDVVTADSGDDQFSFFAGDGAGGFADRTYKSTGTQPRDIAVCDLNNDGNLDVVTADMGSAQFSFFAGNGDGTFADRTYKSTGTQPVSIAVGDFNGDGDLDVVTADRISNQFSFFAGNGDGTFADRTFKTTGTWPYSIAVGDFNGDGDLDVVTADLSSNQFSFFDNQGINGTDGPCCGDDVTDNFNNGTNFCIDGVLITDGDISQSSCEGSGNIWFTGTVYGNYSRCCGDDYIINGFWDNFYNSSHLCYGNVTINADLNKGYCEIMGYNWFQTTFFATWPGIDIGDAGSVIRSVAVGDLDGDGDFDIVSRGTGWSVYVWVNDGTPFDDPWSGTNIGSAGAPIVSVALGDLDGDGDLDIVSGDNGNDVYIWENDGGSWSGIDIGDAGGGDVYSVAVGDFDGDGDLDITCAGYGGNIYIFDNDGSPFNDPWSRTDIGSMGGTLFSVAVGDLDGDGDLDIVSSDSGNDVYVWANDGTPFNDAWSGIDIGNAGSGDVESVAVGDLDGDGDLDIVSGSNSLNVYVWANDGTPFDDPWSGMGIGSAGGSYVRPGPLHDLDGDGDLDIVSGDSGFDIYVWANDGTPFDDPWSGTNIGSTGSGVNSVAVGDLDGDGDFDIVSGDSGFDIYVWENTAINGTNGPCCGDDATDNFYNSSHICTPDTSQGLCEYLSYNWFTGNITGTNASCCGDDGVYDDFYNGTIGTTTHFCYLGTFTEQWIDVNQTICEKYSYNWFSDNVNYPGTYSFTSDEVGNDPSGWIINEAGGSVQVISDLGNHNKVLKLDYDTGTVDARQIFTAGGQSSGIVEFWVRTTDAGIRTAIYIYDGSLGDDLFLVIENDKFRWYAGGATSHDICAAADDTWYHLKITFDTAGTWSLTVDGTEYNGFTFRGAPTDMDNFRIFTTADKIDYIDAVGYSWDPSYSVGDNALAACCGDDNVADIFYNDSQMCSYGGVIFDADHNYYQDWLGDYINYTSGRGVCELKGYDWFETGLPNAWNGTNIGACPNQPRGVVVGDLDNDGDLDIISGDWSHNVYIWDNNGTPFNEAWSSRDIGNADADINDVAVGDLDGDGDLDIVSGDSGYSNVGKVRVWRNDGTPFDDDWFSINAGSTSVINDLGVALGDLDGDGDLDIVSGNNDGGIHVWENDGFPFDDPWFSNYVGSAGSSVFGIAIADLDGDGDLDIISGTLSGSLRVWENDGTPFTDAWSSNSLGSYGSSVAVGDLDGDGDLDLITDRANGNNVYAWENDGTPFIGAWSRSDVGTGNYVRTVVVGDMDNDGDLDILGGDFDRRVRVWVNDGSPFDDVWSLINVGTVSGYVYAIDVGDLDGDGDLDIVSGDQNDDVYVWENFGINGTNGPCCGDDGASDLFYNSSIYCLEGVIGTDLDSSPIACEYFSYDWLSGTTVGTNDPCCGDDGVDDDFYNATDGYGGYCIDGVYAFGDPDDFQSICEYLSNDWFEGATDPIGKCCGDDDSIDDFGNYSLSCCCNGVVIGDGDPCDLDQDGNIDSVCLNGYLPDVYISDSSYQGYIMSDYSPEFLIKNTGNVTVCFSSTEILNTTLNYSPDYGNPDCITPGNSGLFKFHFGRFACDDLDKPFNMIANFTYETDSLISNLNFIVRSPLDIERIEPSIVASLPVNVNEFEDLLITLSNKGSETINYKVDMQASSDTLLLLKIPEGQYTIDELKAEEFSILPRTSIIFELMIAALSEGEKTVAITFNSTGECINVTDSITFKIQGIEVGKGFLDIFEIPGLDWIAILILMIISSIIVYFKVLKK